MGEAREQGFQWLSGQSASTFVVYRGGKHHGKICTFFFLYFGYGIESGFRIQPVIDSFHQQEVHAAFY